MRFDRIGVLAFWLVGLFSGNVEAGQEGSDMKLEAGHLLTVSVKAHKKYSRQIPSFRNGG
jgi:hypothetical protein